MDELYDNLDNYNEEINIAELQNENKALKSKMEEYSLALVNLQKEFDKLSSEHKRLELNYSSLLKTAKAEIQRKTQIITALNLEKDSMILKSYQNKNADNIHKARNCGMPIKPRETNERTKTTEKLKHFEGRKSSTPSERKEQNDPSSRNTSDSPHGDVKSKLLDLAHRGHIDSKISSDMKENAIKPKKDGDPFKGASIKDRRKSVPATRFEKEQTSEDELSSAGGSKNMQQMIREDKFCGKYKDRNFRDSPIFETSSSEEKKYGYLELDHHTQRSSRSDRNKDDRYRVRHKSSHRYRRQSPDRYHGGSKEHYDSHRKFEYERHRAKRTVESPPRDKYHHRSNREQNPYAHDKNHTYEYESSLPQSQERYSKKRKLEQVYEDFEDKKVRMEDSLQLAEDKKMDLDNKKLTVEPHSKHLEDHKFMCGGIPTEQKYIADSEIQFPSCESPDYNYRDVSNQHVKEIQFDATTVLDDPRVSSNKYILKKNDGEVVLRTAIGRNVDIVPVQIHAWGIAPVSTPKALLNRPKHTAENIKVENPANVSIESGEIPDIEREENKINQTEQMIKLENSCERKAHLLPKIDDFKHMEKSLKNMNSYKIPKLRRSTEEMESNHFTETTVKPNHCNIRSIKKSNENSAITMKDVDGIKQEIKPIKENKDHLTEGHQHSSNNEPKLEVSPTCQQKYSDTNEVVEGDLEMSDDNCDDNEQPDFVMKQTYRNTDSENMVVNKAADKQSTHALEKVSPEPSKDKTAASDSKKTKIKRKSRHKDTKEIIRSEDLAIIPEKSVKKKEKRIKSTQIKTKFSELFDDSSSLICPEDLGLPMEPAHTTRLPDKCDPIFEDALDMVDLEKNKYVEKSNIESNSIIDSKINIDNLALPEKLNDKSDDGQTELTDDVIKSIYQNLEPELPDEENVVKTVIISTGVQPPVILEGDGEILPPENQELKIKAIQDLGLEALATSTPHKIWQPDTVALDIQPNPPASGENKMNNGQISSKDNSLVDKSDSNIIESQSNNTNAPDVRIVVKRRRKVIKNQS